MKYLQITACLFCIWLVCFRQKAKGRVLVKAPGTICNFSLEHDELPYDPIDQDKKRFAQMMTQFPVCSINIKGTTLFDVSTTGWTRKEAEDRLERAIGEAQRQMPGKVRWVDTGLPGSYRWSLLAAMLGLGLTGIIGTLKRS